MQARRPFPALNVCLQDGNQRYRCPATSTEVEIHNTKIASGTYGRIYYGRTAGRKVIVKINKKDNIKQDWTELIAQTSLFCATRDAQIRNGLRGRLSRTAPLPHVPRVLLAGRDRFGARVVVMEHVEMTLHAASIASWMTGATLVDCFRQVAALLEILQDEFKFAHRDLKPDNIMVNRHPKGCEVVLIDFGNSRCDVSLEQSGARTQLRGNDDYFHGSGYGLSERGTFDRSQDLLILFMCVREWWASPAPSAQRPSYSGALQDYVEHKVEAVFRCLEEPPSASTLSVNPEIVASYTEQRHGKPVQKFRYRTTRIAAAAKALRKIKLYHDPRWYLPYNTAGINLSSFYPSAVIRELNQLSP